VIRRATRLERWLLVGCLIVSLLSHDFALPRWAYTIMIAIVVVVGRGMSLLVETQRRWAFWIATAVLFLHLFRPELDFAQFKSRHKIISRMNVAESSHFLHLGELKAYPDGGYRFVLVDQTGFVVHLFGLQLSNEVVGTIAGNEIDPGCAR